MAPISPLQTFVSYSRVNQQFAIRLACELKSAGFSVWMDQFDIPTGARWDDAIEKALKKCEIFLFIITPASIASENAKDEMGYAIDHGKYILPVLLEKCEVPLRLRRMQYVDFTQMSFDEGIERAKELLSRLINEIERHNGMIGSPIDGVSALTDTKTAPTGTIHYPSRASLSKRRKTGRWFAVGGIILIIGIVITGALMPQLKISPFLPTPSQTSTTTPTKTLIQTVTSVPTEVPSTATLEAPRSFVQVFNSKEEWDNTWALQFRNGDPRKKENFSYSIDQDGLDLKLDYEYVWAYFFYKPVVDYSNVEMEVVVEGLQSSSETLGLVCQYSDKGWYEFDIDGGGQYTVRYVNGLNSDKDEDQYIIANGFIPHFKYTPPNTIRITCNGKNLSLSVNGSDFSKDFVVGNKIPALDQGRVGIAARADQKSPVQFVVKSIAVSEK